MSPRPSIPDRRQRILEAAERLLLDEGFESMTMSRLAKSVGIGKGSIYREFTSKDDVLEELLQAATSRSIQIFEDAQSLSEGYRGFITALLKEPLLCAAILDDKGILGEVVGRVGDDRYHQRHARMSSWISDLRSAGRIRADVEPENLALALSSMMLGMLTAARTLGPLSKKSLEGALEAIVQMLRGVEG